MTTLCIVSLPVEYNLSSTAPDFGKIQKRTDPESKGTCMPVSLCPHIDTHIHTYNMHTVIPRSPLKFNLAAMLIVLYRVCSSP